jgi:ADP-heptose:LPS heptosyltransferase
MTVLPKNVERVAVSVADFPSLGDQLVLFPLFEGLRRRFPGCRILAASRNELIRLATEFGFADETLIYSRTDWALLRAVRRFRPQLSICLRRRSPRANLCFGRLSGARRTVGYRGGGNGLWHTHLTTFHENIYRARRHLAPLETLGGSGDLRGTVRRLARTSNWQPRSRPYAVLSPCGAWDRKQWGAARYAEVASRLADLHPDLAWYAVIGPREVEQGCGDAFRDSSAQIDVVANAPIDDLARIFLDAKIVIANDCGPAHLAQMAGTPTVQPFDNSDGLNEVAIRSWFDRRPGAICLTPRATAPIDTIPIDAVFEAAREVLDDPSIEGAIRHVG